ncbi:hypothetical protein MRB53_010387 [Persea americana]|uniref:Uncharacterized protein n=1 Tax=Persea americana TaxID=3435 RepID=A0ACC2LRP8_PERAE|nr:hypothetical protein MRB53_010387 [Persea americana]
MLKGLKRLYAGDNQLVNEKDEEFTFITSLTNCSGLEHLSMGNNQFSARILSEDTNNSRTQTNSLAIRGSIGYVAPEYGMGANTSTYGDVYSYGILLLEMLTGKRPSDDMFKNNLNLHQFAKMALRERVMEIIDHRLLSHEDEVIRQSENHNKLRSIMYETLVSLLKIGVYCSNDSPKERMEMKDVVIEMHKVRDIYLSAEKW